MSKFDHEYVYDEVRSAYGLAVSKEKYRIEEAVELARKEFKDPRYIAVREGYVRFRAGYDEYDERRVEWYFEPTEKPKSCSCWIMFPETRARANGYRYFVREER